MASMGAFVANYDANKQQDKGFGTNMFFRGHQSLKEQLQSMKDKETVEAMRKIVEMVAKGQDVSDLFPDVVKNVVSKSTEVKKLVYMYLVRYAEEQQDLALLSISTFQKGLKDPNQLIRASALRVLSSIRVQMIVPIMMLAIKDSVSDLSPYVRKTAAHAIPKLYALDPEQKEGLIDVVEKLLQDKTTLVAGSAVMAFEQLCPDRIDLIHKNYRRLCAIVADIDEWGQCAVINMLTRYARTQFMDPNRQEEPKQGSSSAEETSGSEEESSEDDFLESLNTGGGVDGTDPDLRLLLQACRPLLQSRNSAVVMQVAQLFYHCAPQGEIVHVVKALIRLLKGRREAQLIVLTNITTMSAKYRHLFEQHLKSFYVNASDPTQCRLLKLEILTNIATESNIGLLLQEFQTYVYSSDKEFAAATVHAIGRCAAEISEVTDACLHGLMNLISNQDSIVVGESVIVIKKLLQMQNSDKLSIIKRMTRLLDSVTVPLAKASILWLVGEYVEKVPKLAPDVLRKMAKTFPQEEDIVKLQVLNLSAKAWIVNNKKITLLVPYILAQAKYDLNYDIRDRERFIRKVLSPNSDTPSPLEKFAKKFFMTSKPPPNLKSNFKNRDEFQLGSLSHILNQPASGYQPLPPFPDEAPDSSVRDVVVDNSWMNEQVARSESFTKKPKSFYSDGESDSDEDEDDSSGEYETDSDEESDSEDESESDEDSDEETSDEEEDDDSSEYEDSSEEEDESESESESDAPTAPPPPKPSTKAKKSSQKTATLLDFSEPVTTAPAVAPAVATTTLDELLGDGCVGSVGPNYNISSFSQRPSYKLLPKITGKGLTIDYSFPRIPSQEPGSVDIQLSVENSSDTLVTDIEIVDVENTGVKVGAFMKIPSLGIGSISQVTLTIDFKDTLQPAKFSVACNLGRFQCKIQPEVGELISPFVLDETDFDSKRSKLSGMHETAKTVESLLSLPDITTRISEAAAMSLCFTGKADTVKFSAQTISKGLVVLVTITVTDVVHVSVNSEAVVIGSMILKNILAILADN